jgi:hypothetical protein
MELEVSPAGAGGASEMNREAIKELFGVQYPSSHDTFEGNAGQICLTIHHYGTNETNVWNEADVANDPNETHDGAEALVA